MLAYVLWRHPRAGSSTRMVYEASLVAFHERLRSAGVSGFRSSSTSIVRKVPWVSEADCHEEWYVLDDWETLGALSRASVSGEPKAAYDLVTHSSSIHAATLYGLLHGAWNVDAPVAVWFSRPENMALWVMEELLAPYLDLPESGLWQRQMALGPAPEFCFLGEHAWQHERIPAIVINRHKFAPALR
jgi:hypothetical protein